MEIPDKKPSSHEKCPGSCIVPLSFIQTPHERTPRICTASTFKTAKLRISPDITTANVLVFICFKNSLVVVGAGLAVGNPAGCPRAAPQAIQESFHRGGYRFYLGARPLMRGPATVNAWTSPPGATVNAWTTRAIHRACPTCCRVLLRGRKLRQQWSQAGCLDSTCRGRPRAWQAQIRRLSAYPSWRS